MSHERVAYAHLQEEIDDPKMVSGCVHASPVHDGRLPTVQVHKCPGYILPGGRGDGVVWFMGAGESKGTVELFNNKQLAPITCHEPVTAPHRSQPLQGDRPFAIKGGARSPPPPSPPCPL